MKYIDIVKGGWDDDAQALDRLAISQRPADGHIKSDGWEDTTIITKDALPCGEKDLEVGDYIVVHTSLTLGYITGFGVAVESGVEGLGLKVVTLRKNVDLTGLPVQRATYDDEAEKFNSTKSTLGAEEFGDKQVWIGGVVDKLNQFYVPNTELIALEVTSVPEGSLDTLRIVTRVQFRQPVRPPAYLNCCG